MVTMIYSGFLRKRHPYFIWKFFSWLFILQMHLKKIKMAENIFSTLSNVSYPPMELNSTQLVCWSLLISILMLILRHVILHSTTFPSWLMFNIINKLIHITQGGNFQLPIGTCYLESWVYNVGRSTINVNGGVTKSMEWMISFSN